MKKLFFLVILAGTGLFLNAQVKWYTIEEAIKLNETQPRKIMIDIYTSWCGWCKHMDKNTFNHTVISKYLNEKYYPVKLDAEQQDSISILGHTFKYIAQGNRGYNELAATLLNGKMSYPSVVFLDEKNQSLHLEKGYIEPKKFDMILRYLGEDFYKSTPWESWSASYSSPIAEPVSK